MSARCLFAHYRLIQSVVVHVQGKPDNPPVRTLYIGNLYEETLNGGSQNPFVCYYYMGAKAVGLRRGNQSANNGQFRLVTDQLGSTSLLIDTASPPAVVYREYYKPYGEIAWEYPSGGSFIKKGFTGQRLDSSSGLMYYGVRYYDPALGHFISADPLVSDILSPKSYDRYSYVFHNPIRYTDPTGCCTYDAKSNTYTDVGKLDCTVDDFDNMTARQRLAWVASFQAYFGLGNVFNGVEGAIMYFAVSDREYHAGLGGIDFTPGTSWMSRADAYTLAAMQDGMQIYQANKHHGGPYHALSTLNFSAKDEGTNGPNNWAGFYEAYYMNGKNFYAPGVAQAWGRAEFAAVHYATRRTDLDRGRPTGEQGYLIEAWS